MAASTDIILVDDDESFCSDLKAYFQHKGLTVAAVSDANVALAIDFRRFKVVLIDLDMPSVSGLEIVRNLPNERRPLAIVVSGHSDFETRMQLLDSGADFFISKPVNLGELCVIVKRALGRISNMTEETAEWVLHRSQHSLVAPGGEIFGLSSAEFRVLELLFLSAPEAAPKHDLVAAATGRKEITGIRQIRSLEVMLSRMRIRFGVNSAFPIKSLRNAGYIFHSNGKIVE